jgi:hypothetical protein
MKLGIIISTWSNIEMLKPLLEQIYEHTFFILKDNNISRSWNNGIKNALSAGCTHFAIMNDDIELPLNWWEDCQKKFDEGSHLVFLGKRGTDLFSGWFFVLDKYCLERVGYFDEEMNIFAQDTDFWYKVKELRIKNSPIQINVKHFGSATVSKLPKDEYKEIWNDNWLKLRAKHPNLRMQDEIKR